MISKVSFSALKGLDATENKKNLGMLNRIYGDNFMSLAESVFPQISEISGDTDVFLHTQVKEGFLNDYMHFKVLGPDQKEIAASSYKLGTKPEKYGNTPGMRKALNSLLENFRSNFLPPENGERLENLINTYS